VESGKWKEESERWKEKEGEIFDLQGRKVTQSPSSRQSSPIKKGLYIVGGKKL